MPTIAVIGEVVAERRRDPRIPRATIKRISGAGHSAYIAGWMAQKGADFQTALGAVKATDTILNGDWPDNDDKKGAV